MKFVLEQVTVHNTKIRSENKSQRLPKTLSFDWNLACHPAGKSETTLSSLAPFPFAGPHFGKRIKYFATVAQ